MTDTREAIGLLRSMSSRIERLEAMHEIGEHAPSRPPKLPDGWVIESPSSRVVLRMRGLWVFRVVLDGGSLVVTQANDAVREVPLEYLEALIQYAKEVLK